MKWDKCSISSSGYFVSAFLLFLSSLLMILCFPSPPKNKNTPNPWFPHFMPRNHPLTMSKVLEQIKVCQNKFPFGNTPVPLPDAQTLKSFA